MTDIDIRRAHVLPLKDAKARVETIAERIAERFDVDYGWRGNVLRFTRSGVNGEIAVSAHDLRVSVRLGFLLFALKGAIEREIHQTIEQQFGR
ncbi:MAG TPA: polyhydroxyalkanoic acid synthase [Xanthomonadaceae bacterium]|jgi:putative polyhydroxyalkanoate system protein|nr:polyhydroxyalkanoic acid synthase [Xanthomonadaceae bacterium]